MWELTHARAFQEGKLVTSVMLSHCLTAGIPLNNKEGYGIMPDTENWIVELYAWQNVYVDKLRKDLISIGAWDSYHGSDTCAVSR